MPPRFAYWTILIDNKPTAFRAQKQEELLPTFKQLSRTNPNIVMRWFARGRLWDNPEQAQWARMNAPKKHERRGAEWRPGGQNKDPRARFAKRGPRASAKPSGPRVKGGESGRSESPGRSHRGHKGPGTEHRRPGTTRNKGPWITRDKGPRRPKDTGSRTTWDNGRGKTRDKGPGTTRDKGPGTTKDKKPGPKD